MQITYENQEIILKSLLKIKGNANCADCESLNPSWVSLDFGVFICYNCSGIHRKLGPTITRVKSISLDLWKEEWINIMKNKGNLNSNKYWEANLDIKKPSSDDDIKIKENYILLKYVKKNFIPNDNNKKIRNLTPNNEERKNNEKKIISDRKITKEIDLENFKTVSNKLRKILLKGSPLEILKKLDK